MSSNEDRQNIAKKILKGKGRDVSEQRTERRQRLMERFKSLRVQAVDNLRNLKENEFTYALLSDLKVQILSTLDPGNLIHEDELDYLFQDLDNELKALECEQYDKLYNEELEASTNLMNKCAVCENLTTQNEICDLCAQRHFSGQF